MTNYQETIKTVICKIEQVMGGNHCVASYLRLSQEERRELRENPTAANIETLDCYLNSKLRVNWFTKALGLGETGITLLEEIDSSSQYHYLENQHLFLIKKVVAAGRNGGTNQKLVEGVEDFLETVKNHLQEKLQCG